jgi:hypothetical protein
MSTNRDGRKWKERVDRKGREGKSRGMEGGGSEKVSFCLTTRLNGGANCKNPPWPVRKVKAGLVPPFVA